MDVRRAFVLLQRLCCTCKTAFQMQARNVWHVNCVIIGERLTRGWVPLLRLLAAVPERGGTDAIKLGFQSVELMCSDYMASLPVEQLRRCLEIAAMYANQQVLTASALL